MCDGVTHFVPVGLSFDKGPFLAGGSLDRMNPVNSSSEFPRLESSPSSTSTSTCPVRTNISSDPDPSSINFSEYGLPSLLSWEEYKTAFLETLISPCGVASTTPVIKSVSFPPLIDSDGGYIEFGPEDTGYMEVSPESNSTSFDLEGKFQKTLSFWKDKEGSI